MRILVLLASSLSVLADEGMWLFDHPPRALLKKHYDFDATDAWLSHVMHSAVRFNSGGSGSFVSADGLVMTNHHVGSGALQKLSKAGQDLVAKGFHARTRTEEIKCVDMELNVLISTLVGERSRLKMPSAMPMSPGAWVRLGKTPSRRTDSLPLARAPELAHPVAASPTSAMIARSRFTGTHANPSPLK